MDTDGYTGSGDGMYSPTPAPTHHQSTGGYGGGQAHAGYGGTPTPGCYGGTTTCTTSATPTPGMSGLPVTSTPGGGHLGVMLALAVVLLVGGIGLLRLSRRAPRLVTARHRQPGG